MPVRSRRLALLCAVLLFAALGALIAWTTPWHPLPGPIPGGRVEPSAAADFTAKQIARARAFHAAVDPSGYLSTAVSVLVPIVLGLTPLGAKLVRAVGRPLGGHWVAQVGLGALALAVIGRLVTLPFGLWSERVYRAYGLSTQSWSGWFSDVGISFAINAGVTVGALLLLYLLIRRMPHRWWIPAGAGAFVLVVAGSFAYPVVVEPAFNTFTPMRHGALRRSLLHLAERDGVSVSNVLVADASRRTTALNAYVSGFAGTRRIVVYDTLVKSASPREVRLVVAHELGHVSNHDVLRGTLLGGLAAAAGVCLLYWLLTWDRLRRRSGAISARDPAAVAFLLAIVAVLSFASLPAQNLVSRHVEARADAHSLDLTHDPQGFVAMQRALALRGLDRLRPAPVAYVLFATHPAPTQRTAMARNWAHKHGVHVPDRVRP
ncbi:MAG: M48 family metallopeptidase [Streptosporangiales bacterium]